MELHHKDIIDRGDLRTISRNPNPRQQNEYFHLCLKDKCTEGAFKTVCDVISSVQGNPKMKALGEAMKGVWRQVSVCVCVCVFGVYVRMYLHVCICW